MENCEDFERMGIYVEYVTDQRIYEDIIIARIPVDILHFALLCHHIPISIDRSSGFKG